jgi:Asp/Glu/hydantoin racemase
LEHLRQNRLVEIHDAFLVACYSVHPLTTELKSILPKKVEVPVIGIFEASISTALALLPPPTSNGTEKSFKKFGIITTGNYWEKTLTDGVLDFLGCEDRASCKRFKGIESTGFTAAELYTAPAQDVESRMMEATKRLVKDQDVSVICLGCAGMAGMDDVVRDACIEELGEDSGQQVHIIDGIKAGIAILDGLYRSKL